MSPALRLLCPGLSTTIQDAGRPGFQRFGVPVSGALDLFSMKAANLLVGNQPGTAALEITYTGPAIVVEAESVRIAFAGECDVRIKAYSDAVDSVGKVISVLESIRLFRGQIIEVGSIVGSSVLYMAVEGGFDIPPVLGSLSTLVRGGLGGLNGRALQEGDRIPLLLQDVRQREEQRLPRKLFPSQNTFRIMAGPQAHYFAPEALLRMCDCEYTIGPGSNRMGMRLEGSCIPHLRGHDIISDVVASGSIQIPGTQKPIILLADRQTTGGYPKIATVISSDLAALGRKPIGAKIAFEIVSAEGAGHARRTFISRFNSISASLTPSALKTDELSARLSNDNLVSGVCYACI